MNPPGSGTRVLQLRRDGGERRPWRAGSSLSASVDVWRCLGLDVGGTLVVVGGGINGWPSGGTKSVGRMALRQRLVAVGVEAGGEG